MDNRIDKDQLISEAYQIWRQQPVTKLMLDAMNKHRDGIVKQLSSHAVNTSVDSETYRRYGAMLNTVDVQIKLFTDFQVFKNYLGTDRINPLTIE